MARMMAINLLLLDGTSNGRIKCTISGRTGIIFKIPRSELEKCKNLSELDNDGVYFLIGENGGEQPTIYIGQAGSRKNGKGILSRLSEHYNNPDKNWTEAIVFTTSDNSFGATEISWLENKFCNMAIKAARYDVKNGNDPSPGNITEEKVIMLKEQADVAELILSAIGYKIFEPPQSKTSPPVATPDKEIFYLARRDNTVDAKMMRTPTGYKVLAGSKISPNDDGKRSLNVKNARNTAQIDANGKLLEDVEFPKPSPAAEFVLGTSADGNSRWKTKEGVPLKNFLQGGN